VKVHTFYLSLKIKWEQRSLKNITMVKLGVFLVVACLFVVSCSILEIWIWRKLLGPSFWFRPSLDFGSLLWTALLTMLNILTKSLELYRKGEKKSKARLKSWDWDITPILSPLRWKLLNFELSAQVRGKGGRWTIFRKQFEWFKNPHFKFKV
jgi:hypothetical protein